jgi:hypothetical protein
MSEQAQMSESEKKKEDWMNSKWRPAMGWMYMLTCMTDFVIFPILWSLLQSVLKQPITQWQPLTLQGAGLFHIAMGAVLGIAAMGRTQEKLAGANNGGAGSATPAPASSGFSMPSFTPPAATPAPVAQAPAAPAPSFGGGFGGPVTTPSFTPTPTTMSKSGKPGPMQPPDPEI